MSENTIFVKNYSLEFGNELDIPIRYNEIWRYSGYMGLKEDINGELKELLEAVIDELKNSFTYKVCYRRMKIGWKNKMPVLPFESDSRELSKCIRGCDEIIMFAATIGLNIDRSIARYQRVSPAKALLMQAYGAERVESLCDYFCKEQRDNLKQEGLYCTARFSPGYGDLPLEKQIDFFKLLDCNRQIGISLNSSLLMTPSKSVTALFGIGSNCIEQKEHKCENCNNTDCEFRTVI